MEEICSILCHTYSMATPKEIKMAYLKLGGWGRMVCVCCFAHMFSSKAASSGCNREQPRTAWECIGKKCIQYVNGRKKQRCSRRSVKPIPCSRIPSSARVRLFIFVKAYYCILLGVTIVLEYDNRFSYKRPDTEYSPRGQTAQRNQGPHSTLITSPFLRLTSETT